jgi:predicted nucleic acid-binding protein
MERDSGKKLRIFLDSSVALAASMSGTGASHEVFHFAGYQDWMLLVSPWVLREVRLNLAGRSPQSVRRWVTLRFMLEVEDDELTFECGY